MAKMKRSGRYEVSYNQKFHEKEFCVLGSTVYDLSPSTYFFLVSTSLGGGVFLSAEYRILAG